MRYTAVVTREQWPVGESALVWCGHGHRTIEAAAKCSLRLVHRVENVKRAEVVRSVSSR